MRKKTVGFAGFRPCHDDYGAGGAAPAGRVVPHAAIFTRAAREKISTSKVLQTGIILRHEAVGRSEARAQEQMARKARQGAQQGRARKNFDEQSAANGDSPSP